MANRIHIKIADRGWILEKCAQEIASRASNVTYGTEVDAAADLQYYVSYSARTRRVSPIEVAFFTHSEYDPNARRRYFETANDVEHCVCMSARYADEMIEFGIPADKVTTIAPGVDLDDFRPKVRIGVIGRTYHTGRKGEALVAEVMDIPRIEWRFTGSGWPGPTIRVPEGGMADFYNDLDYVLVPSLYEGGPMSVLEALACGVPIISSDVGWASEYPHIPFRNGDVDSLRQVLRSLVAEREALRSSVLHRTWHRWAEDHFHLFEQLLGRSFTTAGVRRDDCARSELTLLTHGSEKNSQGGPSIRVPRTAEALRKIGVVANWANFSGEDCLEGDLIHLFNVWPPHSSVDAARAISHSGRRLVFSPILLDLSEMDFWGRRVREALATGVDETVIARLQLEYSEQLTWSVRRNPEPGFTSRIRELAETADAVIFLSRCEESLFKRFAGEHECTRLIHNPVDAGHFEKADPQLFRDFIGLDEFVLCVGRIEARKNQLFLTAAAKDLGLPVVLIGHSPGHKSYADAVRAFGGDSVRCVGRVEPGSDLLRSAYAACRVFALPSWAEGAPLAALEAGATGANLVLSNRSGEQEYFGKLARYADPSSIESIKTELIAAWEDANRSERSGELRHRLREQNCWSRYAQQTAAMYAHVHRQPKRKRAADRRGRPYNLGEVLDLSSATPEQVIPLRLSVRPVPDAQLAVAVKLRASSASAAVELRANGHRIAKWELPAGLEVFRSAPLPRELLTATGELELDFDLQRKAREECDFTLAKLQVVEVGSDDLWHILGLTGQLSLREPHPLGNSRGRIASAGFHESEPAGLWSACRSSELYFTGPDTASMLKVELSVPLKSSRPVLRLWHESDYVEVRLRRMGQHSVEFPLNGSPGTVRVLQVSSDAMFRPSDSGSADNRCLGVLVRSLTVSPSWARGFLARLKSFVRRL